MRTLLIFVALASAAAAQDLTVDIHDPTGNTADSALPANYAFADTPVSAATSITLRVRDNTANPVAVLAIIPGVSAGSATANSNFTVGNLVVDKTLSPNSSSFEDVVFSFAPQVQGATTAYLQVVYQIQQNGCSFTGPSNVCPSQTLSVSTVTGNALAPVLVLSYASGNQQIQLQPSATSPLNFGNISTSSSSTLTFSVTNESATAVAMPSVVLNTEQYNSSAFALNISNLPSSIPGSSSASFTVTFSPGQTGLARAVLQVGTLSYMLEGTGVVVADIDALQISYVDSTGVRILPQSATPISFGQITAGTAGSATLNFTVTNPTTSWNAVNISALSATGAGFAITNAPTVPLSIAPGQSITFSVVFTPNGTGSYSGTLAIGTRTFSLAGTGVTSNLPTPSFQLDLNPLTSGEQAHLTIQLASAAPSLAIGQLTMTFSPSVANVTDDPAIVFLATNGRQLQVTVNAGSQTATYNGQSSLAFQTGATAGTITFTLAFPNAAPLSQSFTISPAQVSISSATATRQSPNLVVTFDALDNTYSAGKLSFTFKDVNGNPMTPNPITVDATSAFNQYFSTSKTGGAFSLSATFPVTGDISTVGSVQLSVTNSSGTTQSSLTFQ